jgi:hypothetical protein
MPMLPMMDIRYLYLKKMVWSIDLVKINEKRTINIALVDLQSKLA